MQICVACGVENPEAARFCMACAKPLEAEGADRRDRRVVSVLFADLVGFTTRSEALDVEDVDAFLAPYQRRLREVVEWTGGVVSDFAGDGMMAVFGAPVAHEDDPERAVRAAIEILEAIVGLTSGVAPAGLHVRLGVTTGEALVTVASGAVHAVGDVVNTAARLEAAAPRDGVLVDERTYRATDLTIRYEPAAAVSAKGKTAPVWLGAPWSRFPACPSSVARR